MYLNSRQLRTASIILALSVGASVAAVVTLVMVLFTPAPDVIITQTGAKSFSATTSECRRIEHTTLCD